MLFLRHSFCWKLIGWTRNGLEVPYLSVRPAAVSYFSDTNSRNTDRNLQLTTLTLTSSRTEFKARYKGDL